MWWSRRPDISGEREVAEIVRRWTRATEGAGLVRTVDTVTGPTVIPPKIVHCTLGPPLTLSVQLQPGMVCADITEAAPRLAPHLGYHGLRVEPRGQGDYAIVTLLPEDPLDRAVTVPERAEADSPVVLGQDETGDPVTVATADLGHLAIQGQTGAGKSVGAYNILGQLADRRRAGYPLEVSGIDPSGILLRPWPGSVLGLTDPVSVEAYLTKMTAEMDRRTASIPWGSDQLPISGENPLRFIVCEELPGLWRWLETVDPKAAKRCRGMLARILSEGRKASYRVILMAQRAESAVLGATERAQCSVRLSYRVDTVDSLKMLHPDADPETAETHSRAESGIALASLPGRPLTRLRSPYVDFATYMARVR